MTGAPPTPKYQRILDDTAEAIELAEQRGIDLYRLEDDAALQAWKNLLAEVRQRPSDDQYFPFPSEQLSFQEMLAAVGKEHVGAQWFVPNRVKVPGYSPYRIRDNVLKKLWAKQKKRKRGIRPLVWDEAAELFPAPSGIRPWTKHVALYSKRDYAMLNTRMMSNSWRNPVNAQFKRRCLYWNFLPKINGPIIYQRQVPYDDWSATLHESLKRRINRGRKAIAKATDSNPGWLWFDNSLARGYYIYVTDVPDLPEFEMVDDAKSLLIDALQSIETPGPDQPGRFRPYGGSRNWTHLAETAGDEDKDRWEVIGVGANPPEYLQLEADCVGEGYQYEFVGAYWRSQVGDALKIYRISKEVAVEFCIAHHLILTKAALTPSG